MKEKKKKEKKKRKRKNVIKLKNRSRNSDIIQIPKESRKRSRFFSGFSTSENIKEKQEKENNRGDLNRSERKGKIERNPLDVFNKFRKERKKELNELKAENQVQPEIKE